MLASWVTQYTTEHTHGEKADLLHVHFIEIGESETHKMLYRIMITLKERFGFEKEISAQVNKANNLVLTLLQPEAIAYEFPQWLKMASSAAQKDRNRIILVLDGLDHLDKKDQNLVWLPESKFTCVSSCKIFSFSPSNSRCVVLPHKFSVLKNPTTAKLSNFKNRSSCRHGEEAINTRVPKFILQKNGRTGGYSVFHFYVMQQIFQLVQCKLTSVPIFLKTVLEQLRVYGSFSDLARKISVYLKVFVEMP